MTKKLLVLLGTIATFMAIFTVNAGACASLYGETQIPEALQKDL
jgi:cyclic lactone autoinducer peptide